MSVQMCPDAPTAVLAKTVAVLIERGGRGGVVRASRHRADSEEGSVPSHRTWRNEVTFPRQQWQCHGEKIRTCGISRNFAP